MKHESPAQPSLLQQHCEIFNLNGTKSPLSAAALKEAAWLEKLELPELRLGSRLNKRPLPLPILSRIMTKTRLSLTAMALLLLTAIPFVDLQTVTREHPHLALKGETRPWVFWERDGQVSQWQSEVKLIDGDRLRIEVAASSAGESYVAIVAGNGQILTTFDESHRDRLTFESPDRRAFPGSFQLVSPNEHESLIILWNPSTDRKIERMEWEDLMRHASTRSEISGDFDGFRFYRFQLR